MKLRYGEHRVRVEFLSDGRTEDREFAMDGLGENAAFLELLRTRNVQNDPHARGHAGGDLHPGHREEPTLIRLLSTMRCDVRLQLRNGFYWAVAFLLGSWAIVITQLPAFDWGPVVPPIVLGNLSLATFMFHGAVWC